MAASVFLKAWPTVLADFNGQIPSDAGISWDAMKGGLELIGASISLASCFGLAAYFTYLHRQIRQDSPKGLRRKSLWTTDQINACIITLGLGLMFLLIHYSTR